MLMGSLLLAVSVAMRLVENGSFENKEENGSGPNKRRYCLLTKKDVSMNWVDAYTIPKYSSINQDTMLAET